MSEPQEPPPIPDGVLIQLTEDYVRQEQPEYLQRWRQLRRTPFDQVEKRRQAALKGHRGRKTKPKDARLETLEMTLRGSLERRMPIQCEEVKEDLLALVVAERRRLRAQRENGIEQSEDRP